MTSVPNRACGQGPVVGVLPIGTGHSAESQNAWRGFCAHTPEHVRLEILPAVSSELELLDRRAELRAAGGVDRFSLILFMVQRGNSARITTLAAGLVDTPVAIWCHGAHHSLASASIAASAIRASGSDVPIFYGDDPTDAADMACRADAGRAVDVLSTSRCGVLGPTHPNLVDSFVDPMLLWRRFGLWTVPLSLPRLEQEIRRCSPDEIEASRLDLAERFEISADPGTLARGISFHLGLAKLCAAERLDAVAVNCWTEIMPRFGIGPCLGLAFCDYIPVCEGDLVSAVTLIAGIAIHGSMGFIGDFYSVDEESGVFSSMHCGGSCSFHGHNGRPSIVEQDPPNTVIADVGVLSVRPRPDAGPATIVQLFGKELERLALFGGEIVECDFSNQMQVRVRVDGDPRSIRRIAAGNHYLVVPGNRTAVWRRWAAILGLEVVESPEDA